MADSNDSTTKDLWHVRHIKGWVEQAKELSKKIAEGKKVYFYHRMCPKGATHIQMPLNSITDGEK